MFVDCCLLLLCTTNCGCKLLWFGWRLLAVVVDVCGFLLLLLVDASHCSQLCVVCVFVVVDCCLLVYAGVCRLTLMRFCFFGGVLVVCSPCWLLLVVDV